MSIPKTSQDWLVMLNANDYPHWEQVLLMGESRTSQLCITNLPADDKVCADHPKNSESNEKLTIVNTARRSRTKVSR